MSALVDFGFPKIYPINPAFTEVQGMKCYPHLTDVEGPIDYVISAVPAPYVLSVLEDAARKGVKAAHLFTARFSETGRPEAAELEHKITQFAKDHGITLIGPNSMGIYYPAGKIAFHGDFPKEAGHVGMASQSGMLARETVMVARLRGIRFSKVFSYGNAVDLNECDYLEYLAQDADTKVILLYIEGAKDGRRLFETLRKAAAVKPVIILKGGRGVSGARATSSHTASLSGSAQTWDAMVRQSGAVAADSLEELMDLAASFQSLPAIKDNRVGVVGGSGGFSVLAADQCEQAGLNVVPLPQGLRDDMKKQGISIWDWLSNPADTSIREDDKVTMGLIMEMMAKFPDFDFLITMVGGMGGPGRVGGQSGMTAEEHLREQYHLDALHEKPLLAVLPERGFGKNEWDSAEWKSACEMRSGLINLGVPFYPTMLRAATAARKLVDYYRRLDPSR